jgi:hypothetical protein
VPTGREWPGARHRGTREGRRLVLLSATGEILGRYETRASLTDDVERRERTRRLHPALSPGRRDIAPSPAPGGE